MTFKVAKSNPQILISHGKYEGFENCKVSIAISKKVAKKAVERNRIRRILQDCFLKITSNTITTNLIGYLLTLSLEILTMMKTNYWRNFRI